MLILNLKIKINLTSCYRMHEETYQYLSINRVTTCANPVERVIPKTSNSCAA